MSKSTDERGRLYLPKEVRERFGDRYRIVELPSHVALFPVDDDPLAGLRDAVASQSSIGKAAAYTLKHWQGLTVFLQDGRIEVDSNIVERAIKPVCLTRKNALFAGSASGGESWAVLASLVNTCKMNDIDPETWLSDVLERIVSGRTTINRLDELLPWTWKAARLAKANDTLEAQAA